uniref:Uncharacterized protein n=1 Tax=Myoviridae sp. ctXwe21 TaxID=2825123 RepID=A0A8S5PZY8_9CAUD|nr:MAG TPA: hypothetical protein [Myoviridae sp. ctXwe21]
MGVTPYITPGLANYRLIITVTLSLQTFTENLISIT